ncbi:hypothetical protein JTB14_021627 [Gonioctena quinquepunctata]|nr:hypothetical protein JTB14_021627 [Gonioctena quinquepunctata]
MQRQTIAGTTVYKHVTQTESWISWLFRIISQFFSFTRTNTQYVTEKFDSKAFKDEFEQVGSEQFSRGLARLIIRLISFGLIW